jgi:hypothetical protein
MIETAALGTFLIDPFVGSREDQPITYNVSVPVKWNLDEPRATWSGVGLADPVIHISGDEAITWYPNETERKVLRRALLRSAKIVSEGYVVG